LKNYSVSTDGAGFYKFCIPSGEYALFVEHKGSQFTGHKITISNGVVATNQDLYIEDMNFELDPSIREVMGAFFAVALVIIVLVNLDRYKKRKG